MCYNTVSTISGIQNSSDLEQVSPLCASSRKLIYLYIYWARTQVEYLAFM